MPRDEPFEGVERMVAQHYGGRGRLKDVVLTAVEATITGCVTVRDLASLDHFHTRGEAATHELAQLVHIHRGIAHPGCGRRTWRRRASPRQ
jgi:hypothetical protein